MELVIRLKGGPGSGNFGHAGRPGEVGGSTSSSELDMGVERSLIISMEPYAFSSRRQKLLLSGLHDELPRALKAAGIEESDIQDIHLFGSFVTNKESPNDIDLVMRIKDSTELPHMMHHPNAGDLISINDDIVRLEKFAGYDAKSWEQGKHSLGINFVRGKIMYRSVLTFFERGMEERGYNAKPVRIYGHD